MEEKNYYPNDNKPFIVGNDVEAKFLTLLSESGPLETLREIFATLPYAAAVLDPDRKVVLSNETLLDSLGHKSVESILGKRPGEALDCVHAIENNNHCGVSNSCKVCGALAAMRNTQKSRVSSVSEMRLTSLSEGRLKSYDLKVSISPLLIGEKVYMIMYMNDISNEKRRLALERIFFHDVLNKISSLRGFYELMLKEKEQKAQSEYFEVMGLVLSDLTDEIIAQRQLAAAENGELQIKKEIISITDLIARVLRQVGMFGNPKSVVIKADNSKANVSIISDALLLNRVLTNILKNAVEASSKNETVSLNAEIIDKTLQISVHNPAVMSSDVQMQVFNRSFSTKGDNRGLGTYSIKLLVDRYLGGKVYFVSNSESGTTFYIEFPYNFKN